jgi:hypothetical protein
VLCSGVRLDASSSGTLVFWLKKRDVFSYFERDPYGLTAAPSAFGSTGGAADFPRHATSAALHAAPSPRKRRRERDRAFCMAPILPTVL